MKLNGRRAQSAVIETLMMLLITVVAFSLVYGAYGSWTGAQRSGSLLLMQERIVVEVSWFRKIGNQNITSICVFNIGLVDVDITEIHVNGINCSITPSSLHLIPNKSSWINATYTGAGGFVSGQTYTFVIITKRGTVIERFATP